MGWGSGWLIGCRGLEYREGQVGLWLDVGVEPQAR